MKSITQPLHCKGTAPNFSTRYRSMWPHCPNTALTFYRSRIILQQLIPSLPPPTAPRPPWESQFPTFFCFPLDAPVLITNTSVITNPPPSPPPANFPGALFSQGSPDKRGVCIEKAGCTSRTRGAPVPGGAPAPTRPAPGAGTGAAPPAGSAGLSATPPRRPPSPQPRERSAARSAGRAHGNFLTAGRSSSLSLSALPGPLPPQPAPGSPLLPPIPPPLPGGAPRGRGGPCAAPVAQPGTMRGWKGGAGSAAAAGAVPGGSPWRPGLAGGGCPSYSRRGTWIKGSAGTGPGQPTSSSSAPTGAGCSSPASTATVSWGRGAISPARRRRPPAPWQRRLRSGPAHTLRAERAAAAAGPTRTPSLRHAGAWRAQPLPPSPSPMAGRGRAAFEPERGWAGRAGGGSAGLLLRPRPGLPGGRRPPRRRWRTCSVPPCQPRVRRGARAEPRW